MSELDEEVLESGMVATLRYLTDVGTIKDVIASNTIIEGLDECEICHCKQCCDQVYKEGLKLLFIVVNALNQLEPRSKPLADAELVLTAVRGCLTYLHKSRHHVEQVAINHVR